MQPIDHIEVRYRRADTVGAWTTFTIRNGQSTGQITGIQRGMTYQVEARSIAKNGATSIWTSQTHTVSDATLLPIAPTALTALSVADGVHLAWTISETQRADVEYDVERTNDVSGVPNGAGWVNITNVKATAYTDGLTDGVARWYRVRAVDFQGLGSTFSNSVLSQNKSVQDGADKTSSNTSANTGAVGTLPASDVVNTINAGGGVDFLNPGNTNQGDLSKINQANTVNIVAGAVNTSVVYSSTAAINIPKSAVTIIAQQTITTGGGYVKIRAMMEIFSFSTTVYANAQIIIRKGGVAGTQIAFYGNIFVPLNTPGGGAVIAIEAVDDTPLSSQQYTVTAYSSGSDMQCDSISFVVENAKV